MGNDFFGPRARGEKVGTSYALFCVRGAGDTRHSSVGWSAVPVGPPLALAAEKATSRKAASSRPRRPATAGETCPYNSPSAIGVRVHNIRTAGGRAGEGLGHRGGSMRAHTEPHRVLNRLSPN